LVGDGAGAGDARRDLADEGRLGAMAGEIGQTSTSISGQRPNEAVESTGGDVSELGTGHGGSKSKNGDGVLHFDS